MTYFLKYDDEETLHSMIYYSKNLSLAECNYEIYDKKLLVRDLPRASQIEMSFN